MVFLSELTNSEITALSSVFIAFFAFIVAILQGFITRKHNILSLRPLVSFHNKMALTKDIYIGLSNHGVGPAIITSVYYFIDNDKYELKGGNDFQSLIERIGLTDINFNLECNLSVGNTVIPASGNSVLLNFLNVSCEHLDKTEINEKILKALPTFIINYKCTYNKKYTEKWSKNLANNLV